MPARLSGGGCVHGEGSGGEPVDPCQTCDEIDKIKAKVKHQLCHCNALDYQTLDAKYEMKLLENLPKLQGHHNLRLFGLLCSNSHTRMESEEEDIGLRNFATMLKAFAKLYLVKETQWQAETLDELMQEGQQLLQDSLDHQVDAEADPNILAYNTHERRVKREFDMGGRIFHIELGPKFYATDQLNQETKQRWSAFFNRAKRLSSSGNQVSVLQFDADPDVPFSMLRETLQHFFKKNKFGLLRFNQSRYFLLWKQFEVYFVLDFYGRNPITYHTEGVGGVAAMFLVPTLSSFCVLISKTSVLGPSDSFCIREMLLVKVAGPDGEFMETTYGWRANQWLILASNYAILKADLHLSMDPKANVRNRSALIAGIVAILVSKIDHPALWTTRILNRILCYSVNFYRNYMEKIFGYSQEIDLAKFPRVLVIGQFRVCFELKVMRYGGLYKCVPNLETSDFIAALKMAFEKGDHHLLLQISNQVFAIWKKSNGFYYLFDPFRHKVHGFKSLPNTASLRMFCHLDKLIEVLIQMLWQFTRTSRAYIHVVEVKKITSIYKQPVKKVKKSQREREQEEESDEFAHCKEVEAAQAEADVISLNEEIWFTDDEVKCMDELGQLSDLEEEEEEIGESEYEEEMMPGEDVYEAEDRPGGDSDNDDSPDGFPNQLSYSNDAGEPSADQGNQDLLRKEAEKSPAPKGLGGPNQQGGGGGGGGKQNKKNKNKNRKKKVLRNMEMDGDQQDQMSEKLSSKNKQAEIKANQISFNNNEKSEHNKKPEGSKINPGNKIAQELNMGHKLNTSSKPNKQTNTMIVNNVEMNEGDLAQMAQNYPASEMELTVKQSRPKDKPGKEKNEYTGPTYNLNDETLYNKKKGVNRIDYSEFYDANKTNNKNNNNSNPDKANVEDQLHNISQNIQQNILSRQNESSTAEGKGSANKSRTSDPAKKAEDSKSILRSKTSTDKSETERELEFKKKLERLAKLKEEGGLAEKLRKRFAEQTRCLADECRLRGQTDSVGMQNAESPKQSHDLVVVGTEEGSVASITKLLRNGFRCVDRVYLITPWSNYVIFRSFSIQQKSYFLFEGCTCDINRFRYMDVKAGMEDLQCFCHLSEVCQHIANMRPLQPLLGECF